MRQKNILLVLSAVFVFLFGLCSVSAKVVCDYEHGGEYFEIIRLEFDGDNKRAYGIDSNNKVTPIEASVKIDVVSAEGCPASVHCVFREGFDGCTFYSSWNTPANTYAIGYPGSLISSENDKVYCGNVTDIPKKIPELTSYAITVIQIAIPVILVILGSIDLFKGITAGKEDEMKKGQQMFIKRLVVAVVIFLVVIVVKFFVSIIADTNQTNIIDCIDCFVSNDCRE